MRNFISTAAACIALLPISAFASIYDFTSTETSALGNPTYSFALDTSTAVTSAGGTSFSNVTIDDSGKITTGNAITLVGPGELGGPSFFFIDTDVPGPKAFASGSGSAVTFNTGTFSIADGATDGEGRLIISSASAVPEPASYAIMLIALAGIASALRWPARTDLRRVP